MAIFNNNQKYSRRTDSGRKGACFSVTMPYEVERKLKEIQLSMGLNSRSQTIVFLVHHYEREDRTFNSVERLAKIFEDLKNDDGLSLPKQSELPYNKTN